MNQKKHDIHPVGDKSFKKKYLSEEEIAENNNKDQEPTSFIERMLKKLKKLFSAG
ncbi:hypothetical protein [Mesonia sp. K7]|uniref:hypothetical protein n=1 Tax=Mesonia sp. K7 TaxID=2218606 RepID=UPI001314C741|nr:hypothetical protein [Mesonia sp. K7]